MTVYANFYTGQVDYISKLNLMVAEMNTISATFATITTAVATAAAAAAASETAAATSASSAATAATNAATSETKASEWASYTPGLYVPGTTEYSAKHYALQGQNITYRGVWNSTSYPVSPIAGDRWVISPNDVTISGTPYVAGDSIIYNGSSWEVIPDLATDIPALVADSVLTNNGTQMSWVTALTDFSFVNAALSGTTKLVGSGIGAANISTISVYESNGTTLQGYIGKGNGANQHMYVVSSNGEVHVSESAGASTGRVWHTGNDGPGSGLDADTIDTLQASSFVRTDADSSIPSNKLGFGSSLRQMVDLYGTTYGIGIQSNTLYQRTNNGFAWFIGGVHHDTQFNAGAGGITAMTLSNTGALSVLSSVSTPTISGITSTSVVTNLNADRVDSKHIGTTGTDYLPYVNASGECLINTSDQGAYSLQVGGGLWSDVATFGSLSVGGLPVQGVSVVTRTAAGTVAAGSHNLVTVASNQTLPPAPSTGTTVYFTNQTGTVFSILRNSSLINGVPEDMEYNIVDPSTIGLRYVGGTVGWALL